jgi:hypothetical protein
MTKVIMKKQAGQKSKVSLKCITVTNRILRVIYQQFIELWFSKRQMIIQLISKMKTIFSKYQKRTIYYSVVLRNKDGKYHTLWRELLNN